LHADRHACLAEPGPEDHAALAEAEPAERNEAPHRAMSCREREAGALGDLVLREGLERVTLGEYAPDEVLILRHFDLGNLGLIDGRFTTDSTDISDTTDRIRVISGYVFSVGENGLRRVLFADWRMTRPPEPSRGNAIFDGGLSTDVTDEHRCREDARSGVSSL
jgi:hypothetical protein